MFERETVYQGFADGWCGQRKGLSATDADQANKLYRQCGMYFLKLFVRQCN